MDVKITADELKQRQGWSLDRKVKWTLHQIRLWYDFCGGKVYVAFSGGKDSTVLLYLVRLLYPHVLAVFCDGGLEFPEIREFVRSVENVVILRPDKPFPRILKEDGYPVVSKRVARYVWDLRRPPEVHNEATKHLRLTGYNRNGDHCASMMLPQKWRRLVDAPFLISHRCCNLVKKNPFHRHQRATGCRPYIGTMASDSQDRARQYKRTGCNVYDGAEAISRPLSIWTSKDAWTYVQENDLPYSSVYDMGYHNTGCVFCAFGAHLEKPPNRFQMLKQTHPRLWTYCMGRLGMRKVLRYVGVPIE